MSNGQPGIVTQLLGLLGAKPVKVVENHSADADWLEQKADNWYLSVESAARMREIAARIRQHEAR